MSDRVVLAAIDVGTNSVRLVVAEGHADGRLRVLDDEKETTRLGAGLNETGELAPDRMDAAVATIHRMRRIAEGYGATRISCVGTSAVRVATNGPDLVERVREVAGVELEVLTGEREAKLAFASVAAAFELEGLNSAVADIGGGSVELVLAAGGVVQQVESVDVGAVRLTDAFGTCEDDDAAFNAMRTEVRRAFRERFAEPAFHPAILFGTGGTFTSLAAMEADRRGTRSTDLWSAIRGFELKRADLRHHLDRMRRMSIAEREELPGVSRDRAEIAVAGLLLAEELLRRLRCNAIKVHDRGIREGMLRIMLEEAFPGGDGGPHTGSRLDAVRDFGERCRYDPTSAGHVARLALSVFDQLAAIDRYAGWWASPANRELLEAAALLHDVGYFINYSKHHKHTYHLVVHSDLPGFTHREIELIAQVARYHRRAEPRMKHEPYAALPEDDRDLVRRLGGILRISVGLERTHQQVVNGVVVEPTPDGLRVLVDSAADAEAEVYGAFKKRGLLGLAFGAKVEVVRRGAGDGPRLSMEGTT